MQKTDITRLSVNRQSRVQVFRNSTIAKRNKQENLSPGLKAKKSGSLGGASEKLPMADFDFFQQTFQTDYSARYDELQALRKKTAMLHSDLVETQAEQEAFDKENNVQKNEKEIKDLQEEIEEAKMERIEKLQQLQELEKEYKDLLIEEEGTYYSDEEEALSPDMGDFPILSKLDSLLVSFEKEHGQ